MPSGITHMIITTKALDDIADFRDGDVHAILSAYRGAYVLGCVGPDLAYMPLVGNKEIADALHYSKTNELPLLGLKQARDLFLDGKQDEADVLFAFYLGFCSHIIADGVVHPFVRDKVGDYSVAAGPHRVLEMKLDVFVAEKFLGLNMNSIDFHEELDRMKDITNSSILYESFAKLIDQVHGIKASAGDVKKWTSVMDTIFDVATSDSFPTWYENLMGNKGLSFMDLQNLLDQRNTVLKLNNAIDANEKGITNYLNKKEINFFEDVLPRYFELFPDFIEEAYKYVYENGKEISDLLPAINLDTGRLIAAEDLKNVPVMYKVTV